ncbi:Trm112 family protein [Pseudooceanicola sediminis]|uniref:UPF0434 protein DL237_12540 n=1 Tax=Pseudooceanicola sediminis TaxID=2211117 RepID=A0A399J104_9RHOB|nr:Trm112 family protein [Pseudooceanicola sediminis]KAA2313382.1 Trm112 family protein [Puniceibacterium sp. HSS470]RII38337.1 Trm112 family protein [Pseudooceanicola sediminis]|tara:strand:+ start:37340 stop:37546 length:207 start_codon:yes stop_codon:yes gene_type:complete
MTDPVEAQGPLFDRRMLEALVCPQTHATLRYDAEAQELISDSAHLAFPIRNGIPIMLVDEARDLQAAD